MNLARHELGYSKTERRFPMKATCLSIYSRVVNAEADLREVLGKHFPWCVEWEAELRKLFTAYLETKQLHNVLDYDDLLLCWSQMMSETSIASEISGRFDHILVDEYQDTNRLQAAILRALRPNGQGLTVVGDDAQSIYSFRAATVRNILDFPSQFSPRAVVITLDRNYRSTKPILDAANAVIGLAAERFTKNLWSERHSSDRPRLVNVADDAAQSGYIVERILENRETGITLKSQAVLFRASHHSASLEVELTRRNIPFVKFGGLKFLEAAHVKDVIAVLRWAENPKDRVSGFRVSQLLPGMGPASASRLLQRMNESLSPLEGLATFKPPAAALGEWGDFIQVYDGLRRKTADWPVELEHAVQWYLPHLERKYEDFSIRREDLYQLAQIAKGYPTRERFLTELTLDPPNSTSDEAGPPLLDEDYLILSTIHSAKGQEWKSVFLLNTVDGCMPSDLGVGTSDEIEEERRLLYVAMTRAKDQLHLIVPQKFYVTQQRSAGDRHMYAQRTRFIPRTFAHLFEQVAWPGADRARPNSASAGQIDLKSRLRRMWG